MTSNGQIELSKITTEKLYALSHSINIVLSCEYSEIEYNYISLVDKCFSQCISDITDRSHDVRDELCMINICFERYHSNLLDKVEKNTKWMI